MKSSLGSTISKSVSFCDVVRQVPVLHWDRGVKKWINVNYQTDMVFNAFLYSIRKEFDEELEGKPFKIYQMPHDFHDINQRIRIETQENFFAFVKTLAENIQTPPSLYVFNSMDNSSPGQLPDLPPAKSKIETPSQSSDGSARSSSKSLEVRERDSNTCITCGYRAAYQPACHILERKNFNSLSSDEKKALLKRLGLESINSIANQITLCVPCHKKFDSYELAIHPADNSLVISNKLKASKLKNGAGNLFSAMTGTKISFNGDKKFWPSKKLLEYRYSFSAIEKKPVENVKRKRGRNS